MNNVPTSARTRCRTSKTPRLIAVFVAVVVATTACSGEIADPFVPIPPGVPPPPAAAPPAVSTDLSIPRPSAQLWEWSPTLTESTGISQAALNAYGFAELLANERFPGCNLSWNTIAGIGYVETRHGTYNFARLNDAGVAEPPIVGVPLDGSPGFEEIRDTDGGELDGDTEFDRAVGPMQFIPETWRTYGIDASGDGIADPNQIDDAAASAALKLCAIGGDLSQEENWVRAIMSYNASRQYVRDVRDAAAAYSVPTHAR